MLSVFSCTMSVFSRLSASTKAPCSTVSSSVVAALSCSAVLSSFQAACACGCNRLLTVATMACRVHSKGSTRIEEEGRHERLYAVLSPQGEDTRVQGLLIPDGDGDEVTDVFFFFFLKKSSMRVVSIKHIAAVVNMQQSSEKMFIFVLI